MTLGRLREICWLRDQLGGNTSTCLKRGRKRVHHHETDWASRQDTEDGNPRTRVERHGQSLMDYLIAKRLYNKLFDPRRVPIIPKLFPWIFWLFWRDEFLPKRLLTKKKETGVPSERPHFPPWVLFSENNIKSCVKQTLLTIRLFRIENKGVEMKDETRLLDLWDTGRQRQWTKV